MFFPQTFFWLPLHALRCRSLLPRQCFQQGLSAEWGVHIRPSHSACMSSGISMLKLWNCRHVPVASFAVRLFCEKMFQRNICKEMYEHTMLKLWNCQHIHTSTGESSCIICHNAFQWKNYQKESCKDINEWVRMLQGEPLRSSCSFWRVSAPFAHPLLFTANEKQLQGQGRVGWDPNT